MSGYSAHRPIDAHRHALWCTVFVESMKERDVRGGGDDASVADRAVDRFDKKFGTQPVCEPDHGARESQA